MNKNVIHFERNIDKQKANYFVDYVIRQIDGHLRVENKKFNNRVDAVSFQNELAQRLIT